MQPLAIRNRRRKAQAGYSLLMVIFMAATMLILAAVAAPSILTQGRREMETEMIWRGEQYERAIGMYYRKFGRYPTKIEDLTTQTNGLRFLRQAYKDPTNKEDGSWRFIYVGPNGELIGSTRNVNLLQGLMGQPGAPGIAAGALTSGPNAPPSPQDAQNAASGNSNAAPGATPQGQGGGNISGSGGAAQGSQQSATGTDTSGTASAGTGTSQNASGGFSLGSGSQQGNGASPLSSLTSGPQAESLTGSVLGGNIIGVGSKTKKPSLKIYMKGDTYDKWEFIWNPLQQATMAGAAPNVNQSAPGASPAGQTTQPGQQSPSGFGAIGGPSQNPMGAPVSTQPPSQ